MKLSLSHVPGRGRGIAALGLVVLGLLWMGAAASRAATPGLSYSYLGDIGTPDTGVTNQFVHNPIAVSNDDGNVFLTRQFDPFTAISEVDIMTSNGTPVARPVVGVVPSGVAVTADGGSMFLADSIPGPNIQKYDSDGAATPSYTHDALWSPGGLLSQVSGMAVDPTTDELVVADVQSRLISRFNSTTGALVSSFDGSSSDGGRFTRPNSIAVAPNGDVYVIDNPGRVEHMGADGRWKGRIDTFVDTVALPGIAVNPQNGDVAVEVPASLAYSNDTLIRIYTSANALKETILVPSSVSGDNNGLAFSSDGTKLYVARGNGTAHVFAQGTRPGLDAPTASNIAPTSMRLTGVVATNGEATTARIEYCVASDPCGRFLGSDGASPWHRLPDHSVSDPDEETIVDDATGLASNVRYLVRSYAVNDANQVEAVSSMTSVTTAISSPLVQTGVAVDVGATSAELTGSVDNTFGAQTTYHFEYGLDTSYGSRLPAGADGVVGNLRTPRVVTQIAEALQQGATYHYRLVATSSGGTTASADRTFTTLGVGEEAPRRGYEQVTAADKNGLALQPNWGFQVAPDGSAIEYAGTSPASSSPSAAATSRYIARRGQDDWSDPLALDPPFTPARGIVNAVTLAVSDDFKHALVVSQVALAPGATTGSANLYVTDVDTGTYRLLGTAAQNGAFVGMSGTLRQNTFVAGAPDFSWVVVNSRYPLVPGAPQTAMYRWTATGGLSVISRLPDDSVPADDTAVQSTQRVQNRFVSDDGDTVAYALLGSSAGVYRRSGGQTVAISVGVASGGPSGIQPGFVDGISRDGRYVIFHSTSQLTDDDQDSGTSMYRYDAQTSGQLEYLGPQDGVGDGTIDVLWVGDDGKTAYFNGTTNTVDADGQPITVDGLLAWREGKPGVDIVNSTPARTISWGYGSPNGRYFNLLAANGGVYLYDADAGETACISCTASGTLATGRLPSPDRNISNRLSQVVTDDGHAYFNTTTPLLSADRNASVDVYEYYKGRLTLISPGARDFTATLVDISPDGRDVFFTTAEGLVGQDTDQSYDLYDARVGGGLAAQNPAPPAAPCAKSECAEPGSGPVVSPPVGSLPQHPVKDAGRSNQEKVRLSLSRVSVGLKSMKLTFHASQRGRVKVSGARVVTTYRNVSKAGTYSVSVPLSRKARSLMRAHKKVKLSVKVSLAGGWGTASAKYSRTLGN
jgi:DNA-binding beta-propeller fold protein YncE